MDFYTALSKAGPEMIDILAKCFGIWDRCIKLFNRFPDFYLYKGSYEAAPYKTYCDTKKEVELKEKNKDEERN